VLLRRWLNDPLLDIRYRPTNVACDNALKTRLLEDVQQRAILEQHNQADIELCCHLREHFYAKQVAEYGPGLKTDLAAFQQQNETSPLSLNESWNVLKRNLIYKPWVRWRRIIGARRSSSNRSSC
jgi:hypothetical protein